MTGPAAAAGPVPGFEAGTFSHGGREHEVYRAGTGRAVIVVNEMPGLHPGVTEEPGHPARAALDRVMSFLDERPRPEPGP